jgi:multisubunit Na+/H+ antiporter MnhB subunit
VSRQSVIVAVDIGIAVLLAVLLLIASPGVAVTGMVALVVVFVCAVSFGIERFLDRRRRRAQGARIVKESRRA